MHACRAACLPREPLLHCIHPELAQQMFGRTENQDWCHIQVIGVTAPEGILLCAIAASGILTYTPATFNGYTSTGTNVSTNATLPPWQTYTNVTLDTTWQPLTSISIVTRGMILGSSPHKHAMNAPHFYPNASVPMQRPSCAKVCCCTAQS